MSRREWPFMVRCSHEGCKETATYRYPTRRDMVNSFEIKHYGRGGWLCTRHTRPNEVLSATNTKTVAELVNEQRDYGRFFGNSGFISGPGFKVWSKDLPEGARLIVTAEVVLPEGGAA